MPLTHIAVGTNDIEKARKFYDAVLATIGWTKTVDLGDTGSILGGWHDELYGNATS